MVSWDGIFLWAFIMNTLKLWGSRSLSLQRLVQRPQSLLVTSVIAGEKFTEHEKVMWMLSIFPEKSNFILPNGSASCAYIIKRKKKKKTLKSDPEFYFNLVSSTFKLLGLSVCVALILNFGGVSVL